MLIPLQFQISTPLDLLYLPLNGLLFTSWFSEYWFYIPEPQAAAAIMTSIGNNFLIGLMLALPAILFNYRLSKSPANKPARRLAAAALVFSSLMVLMVLTTGLYIFGVSFYYSYMLLQNIQTFPTVAVGAFIILPLMQRQAVLIASPENMHSSSPEVLQRHPKSVVAREVTLATVLWASLYFLPFLLFPDYNYYHGPGFSMFSLACGVSVDFSSELLFERGLTLVSGSVVPLFLLPSFCILSSLRFVFVRDIYRYLKHEITHRRLLYTGLLADFFTVIAYIVISGVLPSGYIIPYIAFPLPLLAVAGMLVARLHRSVLPVANRIWDDVEARMWFEKEEKRQGVAHVLEKPGQPEDEMITVPLTYMVVSHIRKRRHNESSRRSNEE